MQDVQHGDVALFLLPDRKARPICSSALKEVAEENALSNGGFSLLWMLAQPQALRSRVTRAGGGWGCLKRFWSFAAAKLQRSMPRGAGEAVGPRGFGV